MTVVHLSSVTIPPPFTYFMSSVLIICCFLSCTIGCGFFKCFRMMHVFSSFSVNHFLVHCRASLGGAFSVFLKYIHYITLLNYLYFYGWYLFFCLFVCFSCVVFCFCFYFGKPLPKGQSHRWGWRMSEVTSFC